MKIVKFKDGTFGVRRWHLVWGYQLLSKYATKEDYYWFHFFFQSTTHMTYDEARKVYTLMKSRKNKEPKIDFGTPIPKEDYSL